ncbi:MAG TPA: thioredoxin domain-containing protein, partial [Nannocystaceae bacterium]|nr:thioredoxin domain-containing protein [Nannocystaceae bacterium]
DYAPEVVMTKRIVPFVLLALLSCRRDQQQPLAAPAPTNESSTAIEDLARQQDAIVRQQDVIIAQQGELLSELRALRQQLGGGEGDIGMPSERAPERPTRPGQPDKAATYKVPVDGAQARGPAGAKITIVEWADFQCPFCSRVDPTIAELMKDYEGELRHVFMHNPLPMHDRAMAAAIASEAAGRQGKFWPMYELLFANQRDLGDESILKFAKKLKLNTKKFKRDIADEQLAEHVKRQQDLATSLGARGTPAFFINGRFLSGAQPKDAFKVVIDEELAKADKLLSAGVPRTRLYETIITDGRTAP